MSYGESVSKAKAALAMTAADKFTLSCNCGWGCEETRPYVLKRIDGHFNWPDATPYELVTVEPIFKGATP